MPAGAALFQSKNDSPSFGNYGFGTVVAFNLKATGGLGGLTMFERPELGATATRPS